MTVLSRKPIIHVKRGKVAVDHKDEVAYALSICTEINDFG